MVMRSDIYQQILSVNTIQFVEIKAQEELHVGFEE